MTSAGNSGSRKRSAPSERGDDYYQPLKRTRTFSAAAAELTSSLFRGASWIKEKMADWVLTPRTDFCEIYNVRRKDEPRRKLVQGELTNRPGLGGIRGRMENLAYQDGESYISDRRVADPTSYTNNQQSKYTNPSFRFGNTSQSGHQANNLAGYHAKTGSRSNIIGRQSLLPSEKYGKRRSGENFKEYTNFGHRLFGKSPRKMKQYGSTVDRVRNIEEKNNYARLLATITDEKMICVPPTTNKYSNFRPTHVRNRDDDVIVTGVEKSTNQRSSYGQAPSWEPVDDSLLYMRTTQDLTAGVKPHCLRPWNNNSNQKVKSKTTVTNGNTRFRAPRDHSTPFTNQRSGLFVESTNRRQSYRTSTNGEREDSDDDDKIWTNQNQASSTDQNASLGLTGFVRRVREGLQTKRTVDDVLYIDDDVTKWMTSPTERKEGRSPGDRKKRSPLIRKVTSPRCVLSRVREVIDLEKPNDDDEDDVVLLHNDDEVEVLEVLTPNKSRNNRDGSPDVITIEAPPMTSSRQRDGLEERLKAIPYADRAWVRLQREESEERAKAFLRSRVVAEMEIKVFDESRKKQTERLEEAIKKQLRIAELVPAVIEEPEEEEEEDVYPELTTEMENVVDSALYGGPPSQVLVDHMRIQIRRSDVQTLEGTTWLNDEVINFHMNLMTQRGEEEGRPKVHAFNTFFYQKLVQQGHSSLKRWTRKIDVFSKDYLVVPVHLQMHWCMAIVDFRKKEIRYYDSMGGRNNVCLKAVKKYLEEESIDKQKKTYDTSAWQLINAKGPQQMNGSDCGVFSTICAEHVTRDAPLTYTQDLMPYFRRRMVYEIMSKKLMQ